MTVLFRNRDGMVIAGCTPDSAVQFGEDPSRAQTRQFISPTHAMAFLRTIADADQREYMVANGNPPEDTYTAHIEEDSDTNLSIVRTN